MTVRLERRLEPGFLVGRQKGSLAVDPFDDALLDAPDVRTRQGFRNHTVLLFLYNSGARASEAGGVTVGDLDLPGTHQASVRLMGKGPKLRRIRSAQRWPRARRCAASGVSA